MASSAAVLARAHAHESLMGSMMAQSTPRVLLHSKHVKRVVTLLEVLAAVVALSLFVTLFALHLRFVRRDGCEPLLRACDLTAADGGRQDQYHHHHHYQHHHHHHHHDHRHHHNHHQVVAAAPIIQFAVEGGVRFRFSQERGLLLLSDHSLAALNVTIAEVPVRAADACLGDVMSRFVLARLVGYDTVAINAFARMRRRIQRRDGYVLSLRTRRVLNLMHADPGLATDQMHVVTRFSLRVMWKCGAIMTAAFIMCTTGALVAFTLKEVQLRMIKLTMDLQFIMRSQMGYGRVIVRYALDALVFIPIVAGMLFFLFEFFDDQVLAFVVLILTWLCEFAASGSTRHWISRQYLPKLFFCYFGAFHVYFFSFPLGFSWLALATSLVFMLHAALAVWNHCELPLLRRERHTHPHSR